MVDRMADGCAALPLALLTQAAVTCADALPIQHAGIATLALDHYTRARGQSRNARRSRL
jgi:hypothetical protein